MGREVPKKVADVDPTKTPGRGADVPGNWENKEIWDTQEGRWIRYTSITFDTYAHIVETDRLKRYGESVDDTDDLDAWLSLIEANVSSE